MRIQSRRWVYAIMGVMLAAAFSGPACAQELLPEGLQITDEFRPGLGSAIGKVELLQGQVVIMHADETQGYWARQGLPLFKQDVIVTREQSRVRLLLKDESVLTVGSRSRMVLDESVYDQRTKSRFSFLRLSYGKMRCLVKKMLDFKRSEFKVKTATAVAGVRGSDFVVEADQNLTVVTAFEQTELEVIGVVDPEVPPVILADFQKTEVPLNELPTEPVELPIDVIEQLKQDFIVTPEPGQAPPAIEAPERPTAKTEPGKPVEVLFSERVLVEPLSIDIPQEIEEVIPPEVINEILQTSTLEEIKQEAVTIIENITQGTLEELPGFPDNPDKHIP